MKYFILSFFGFCISPVALVAQEEEGGRPQQRIIFGKVVDEKNTKGIEAASVQLYLKSKDKAETAAQEKLVSGMLTAKNGDFRLENLPVADSFRLLITAIGYKSAETIIVFTAQPGRRGEPGVGEKDLGNIKLQIDAEVLQSVVVTAQRPALQMGIDRRVFNVEKSLVATGGTAIDVMKNIPSVTVAVDGTVELRGNTPQVFVDGLPTILTLDQIPADNIERIELITNPSAKFDASSGGGIINVVLKKNKRMGLNGIASIGAGAPKVLNGNLTINLRQGRFNFFGSANYNRSGGTARTETFRQNKSNGITTDYFRQYSATERLRRFTSARFGMDFFMDNRNTFTLSQNFVKGRFSSIENQHQLYYDINDILTRTGDRLADSRSQFKRSNTELTYRHQFPSPGEEFTASASYNSGDRTEASDIFNDYFKPDGSPDGNSNTVRNAGKSDNSQFTLQADYIKPFSPNGKIETGIRSFINDYRSIFDAFAVDGSGETKLPLSNHYKYRENVHAAYFTYSNQWKTFRYQAGLRAEYSRFKGELVDSAQTFGYEYPTGFKNLFNALFPSVFITKELGEDEDIQFNYSRRIRRPNFWQMNPFIDINDPLNIRQGNPQLKPEFVNSFELNYSTRVTNGNFLASLFWRNNPKDITQYSDTITAEQYQQLNNAAIDPNAILNTFINANVTNRYGAEVTLQQKIGKRFEITPTANAQYRKVKASIKNANIGNEGFNWEGKLILNYQTGDIPSAFLRFFNFQLIGEYESREVIPQGRTLPEYSVDLAIRKDLWPDKRASLTLSVNDLFNTLRYGTIYDTDNFYQEGYRRWNVRTFRLTFTYKFGKSDFQLFKRNDNRENGDENRISATRE
ncbi:MAG: outer membrane beta-barrel family protein [Chitinophagaceae bacterium]|nr:outer membrane beta-barrel family protein [Chitinophagaceae bacterium]